MRFSRLLLIFVVLILLVFDLAAQSKITEKQFNEIDAKGTELLKSTSYRLMRKVEFFEDSSKPGTVYETFLKEYISGWQWHVISEKFIDEPMRWERLRVGRQDYARRKSGEWVRAEDLNEVIDTGRGEILPQNLIFGNTAKSYKYRGKVEQDGKKADLYEISAEQILDASNDNKHLLLKIQCWFRADGQLLKKIEEVRTKGKKALKRTTTTIDYDTEFKIEAPIK